MPKTKLQSFLIIVFFIILYHNSVQCQEDYGGNCKNTDAKQSPINIIPPFTFTSFNGEFQFNTLFEGFLENNNHSLRLEGDFGSIIYGPKVFNTYEINFKAPSEHTIGEDNVTLPLEIQISSISEDNSRVNLAILFSKDPEDSSFLYTLGFGKGLLQHLKPSQFLEFKGSFSLKEIVPTENKFFMYQGSTTSTPCDSTVWLIAYNTFRISQRQIDDFPKSLLYKKRPVQNLKHREIFITFYPGLEKKAETEVSSNNTNKTGNGSNQTKNDSNASKTIISNENDKLLDGEDEIASKIQNKDSFKILGDTTIYDFDFYGGETANKNRGIKFIRNEDYLVVYDKEYIKEGDSSTVTIDDKVVDQIIDSLEKKKNKANCLKKNLGGNEENTNTTNSSSIEGSNKSEGKTEEANNEEKKKGDENKTEENSKNEEKKENKENKEEEKQTGNEESKQEQNKNQTNETEGSEQTQNQNKTDNLANFFEKDFLDLWTVEKISKNLQVPSDSQDNFEQFTFKKPDQNKIFLNLNNKPLSFLQLDFQPEESKSSSPFFVITEDMIKNSQNSPIIIDANLLQNLISSSNSKDGSSKNNNNKVNNKNGDNKNINENNNKTKNDGNNKKINETKSDDQKDVTSFVQTKLVGLVKERLTEEDFDSSKLKKSKEFDSSNKEISFDGYVPIAIEDEDESSKNSFNKNSVSFDKNSLDDKSPEEIEALKKKMQKMLDFLNDKIEDGKKTGESSSDDESESTSLIKDKLIKRVEKTKEMVDSLKESALSNNGESSKQNEEVINRLKQAAKLSKENSEKSTAKEEDSNNDSSSSSISSDSSLNGEEASSFSYSSESSDSSSVSSDKNEDSISSSAENEEDTAGTSEKETSKSEENDSESSTSSSSSNDESASSESSTENDESSVNEESYSSSDSKDLSTILDSPSDEDPLTKLKRIVVKAQKDIDFPGQGRKAVDKSGKWDGINVWNISSWPEKCKFGSYQSPIHIGLAETFFVEPHMVTVDYGKPDNGKIEIFNDGYKLIVKGGFGSLKYGDHELPAKEVYIHHPSEHTFGDDQSRTDFEIQILHEDQAGARVMVAVFLHNMGEDENNEFLEDLGFDRDNEDKWLEYTEKKSVTNQKIDLSKLVGAIPHYITYDGALTTPPCTEGVKWIILRKRKKVTQKQIKAFQLLFGKSSNVRGTQELGSRKLKIF